MYPWIYGFYWRGGRRLLFIRIEDGRVYDVVSGDALMDHMYYESPNDHIRRWSWPNTDQSYTIFVTYNKKDGLIDPETLLHLLSLQTNYDGDYENKEFDDTIHYFTTSEWTLEDPPKFV